MNSLPVGKQRTRHYPLAICAIVGLGMTLVSCAITVLPGTKYPPSLRWHTLTTDHFLVHYHDGLDTIAPRAAAIAEDAHTRLAAVLKWEPASRTHLVLSDTVDEVAGSAIPVPYNAMYISLTPPVDGMFLLAYDDWLRLVITHEYAHILHLDTVAGLNRGLRRVFGRVPFVVFPFISTVPNLWQPVWMVEGLATHEETELGTSDRRDSAFTDMILRMAVLDDAFPAIDQADGVDRWPAGHVPYLFGARFYRYLADQYGEHVPAALSELNAGQPFTFWVGSTAQSLLGSDYAPIWARWRSSLEARFDADRRRVLERGATVGTPLTRRGGMILGPSLSPDGATIAYTEDSFESFPTLRLIGIDGAGDRALTIRNSGYRASWSPDGTRLAFSQIDAWRNYAAYSDLYLVDARTGNVERLTRGARAADPDFSPDGRRLVFVARERGRTRLATFDLHTRAITGMTPWSEAPQYAAPRWSPDGARIAVTVWTAGRQDIVLVDAATGGLTPITSDRAMDVAPTWSRDGRAVHFASDRTGIYNAFSYTLDDGRLTQTTNVVGGAFTPIEASDGRLVFSDYSAKGFDLQVAEPFDLSAGAAPNLPTARFAPPVPAIVSASPPTSYAAGSSLAPRYWAPVLSVDAEGTQYGFTTGGLDVLGYHKFELTAAYGPSGGYGVYALAYRFDRWFPSLDLSIADVSIAYGDFFREPSGDTSVYWERRRRIAFDVTLPVATVRWAQYARVGYHREAVSPRSATPLGAQPPAEGTRSGIHAEWRFEDAHEFGHSISPEDGRSVTASFQRDRPSLGSDFDTTRYVGAWYEYVRIPLLNHHVLALRAVGGTASGDVLPQRTFQLGGATLSQELLADDLGTVLLRGYPARSIRGQHLAAGSFEYRFPLWNVERGWGTRPVFVHRTHGALFADSGAAWDDPATKTGYRTGVGAQLGTDLTLAYRFRIRVLFGIAFGLNEGGETQTYVSAGHAF